MNKRVFEYSAVMDEYQRPMLREKNSFEIDGDLSYNSPVRFVNFMNNYFHMENLCEEYVYVLALDSNFHPLGLFELSHGIVDSSHARGREIFMRLLLIGASRFILVHNHPTGDVTPSKDDIKVATKLKEMGDLLSIPFVDSIIIGRSRHYSFHEGGVL